MGGKTQTETSTNRPDDQAYQAYSGILRRAQEVGNTPYVGYDAPYSAAWNDNQQFASNIYEGLNGQANMMTGFLGGLNQEAAGLYNGIGAQANVYQPYYNQASSYTQQGAQRVDPTKFSAEELQQYMSPYTDEVVNKTMANIQQNDALQQNRIISDAIKQGNAFGGDRMGLAQAELARNQNLASGQTIAGLRDRNYSQALGEFNTQQAIGLAAGQNNAARALAAGAQMGQLGTGAQQAALMGPAAQLQAMGLRNAMAGQYLANNQQHLNVANQLAALGTTRNQLDQNVYDRAYQLWQNQQRFPYEQIGWLGGLATGVGSQMGGTSQTEKEGGSGIGQGLGGLLSLGSMFMPSDERVKENKRVVGELYDGSPVLAYNFPGEPTQLGLSAQEVQRRQPEAVRDFDGILGVNYDAAVADAENVGLAAANDDYPLMEEMRFAAGGGVMPFASQRPGLASGYIPMINLPVGNTMPRGGRGGGGQDPNSGLASGAEKFAKAAKGAGWFGGSKGNPATTSHDAGNGSGSKDAGSSTSTVPGPDTSTSMHELGMTGMDDASGLAGGEFGDVGGFGDFTGDFGSGLDFGGLGFRRGGRVGYADGGLVPDEELIGLPFMPEDPSSIGPAQPFEPPLPPERPAKEWGDEGQVRGLSNNDIHRTLTARMMMGDLQNDFKLNRPQAAGLVGNLAHESVDFSKLQEMKPLIPGSRGGYGYAQWTGPRRRNFEAYAADKGLDPASYEANYGFLKHELGTPEGAFLPDLRRASNPAEAAIIVQDGFLRPSEQHAGTNSRIQRAESLDQNGLLPSSGVAMASRNSPALAAINRVTPATPRSQALAYAGGNDAGSDIAGAVSPRSSTLPASLTRYLGGEDPSTTSRDASGPVRAGGGLFGGLFGGSGGGLTDEQRSTMLAVGLALMASNKRNPLQAIGEAGLAGLTHHAGLADRRSKGEMEQLRMQQLRQSIQHSDLQNAQLREQQAQQLRDQKREQDILGGGSSSPTIAPTTAAPPMPVTPGPVDQAPLADIPTGTVSAAPNVNITQAPALGNSAPVVAPAAPVAPTTAAGATLTPTAATRQADGGAGNDASARIRKALASEPNMSESLQKRLIARLQALEPKTQFQKLDDGSLVAIDPYTKKIERLSEPFRAPTPLLQNYESYVKQETEAGRKPLSMMDYDLKLRREESNRDTEEEAFKKKMGEGFASQVNKIAEDGMTAVDDAKTLQQAASLIGQIGTGPAAALQAKLGQLGIKTEGVDKIEAFNALIDKMTPQQRLPGAGATSDFDARMFKNSLPGLMNTPDGNKIIVQTLDGLIQNRLRRGDVAMRLQTGELSRVEAAKEFRSIALEAKALSDNIGKLMNPDKKAAAPTAAPVDLPKPSSPADFQKLKSGDRFVAPDGSVRVKP